MTQRIDQLRELASKLLDLSFPVATLRQELIEMTALLANSRSGPCDSGQSNAERETQTPNGLALSPAMAARCADDFVRTISFIRGTNAAINDARQQFPDRPARILYVGCGPYATLVVPLMAAFSPTEAVFTLLDVHVESIASIKSIVDAFGLSESVAEFVTTDAGLYQVCPDSPPDVILMEIMQACLQTEPQVEVSRHLLRQTPNAILIPQEVSIHLEFIDPAKEFDLASSKQNEMAKQQARIAVGRVFVLNRESINSWEGNASSHLCGSSVQVPDSVPEQFQAMLYTNICIYQNFILKSHDSGLTCPRVLPLEKAIRPGDTIHFKYELGSSPGLSASVDC